jgi:hypothetical protein
MAVGSRRVQVSGPAALRVLGWLARVGPATAETVAVAFAWTERRALQCVAQLETDGWIRRQAMTRGDGSLLLVTPGGVDRVRGTARAPSRPPSPTWWSHHVACAWTAAWFTVRGRAIQGPAEIDADDSWRGELSWRDGRGPHQVGHRPDLAWLPDGGRVAVEVELARKATPRLEAVLDLHAAWRADGRSAGVIYVCADELMRDRVVKLAADRGLSRERGGGLRAELLDEVQRQAREACEQQRAESRRSAATADHPSDSTGRD